MAEIGLATANVQLRHDKSANLRRFKEFIEEAAGSGAKLIVFPECSLQGYLFGIGHSFTTDEWEYHYANAESVPGPSTQFMLELAQKHDMVIVYGMTEKVAAYGGDVLADSAVTVSPQGVLGVYRKVHCGVGEKIAFQPGSEWPVYDTHIGRIGTLICYDVIFPEAARELVLRGAEILAFPTVWPSSNKEGYEDQDLGANHDLFCRARALENQVFFVSSNACETDDVSDMRFYGHSQIVHPTGEVLAISGFSEKLLVVKVDVQLEITRARTVGFNGLYFCKDRRPETYGVLTDASFPFSSFSKR